jgi:hypothetical protein
VKSRNFDLCALRAPGVPELRGAPL